MYKIAICDDNLQFMKIVKIHLEYIFDNIHQLCSIACFNSGKELLQVYIKNSYQIVFLDMDIPMENSIEIAHEICKQNRDVYLVLISESENRIFLSKEISVFKITDRENFKGLNKIIEAIIQDCEQLNTNYGIKLGHDLISFKLSEIMYVESQDHYVTFHLTNKEYKIKKTISVVSEELKHNFIHCHASFIVNLIYVKSLINHEIVLLDGTRIPISRQKENCVRARICTYFEQK